MKGYLVRLRRDTVQFADVHVDAADAHEAGETARRLALTQPFTWDDHPGEAVVINTQRSNAVVPMPHEANRLRRAG